MLEVLFSAIWSIFALTAPHIRGEFTGREKAAAWIEHRSIHHMSRERNSEKGGEELDPSPFGKTVFIHIRKSISLAEDRSQCVKSEVLKGTVHNRLFSAEQTNLE